MNSKQRIGLAIGGGIIALAAAVGAGAFAANLAGGGSDQGGAPGYGQRQSGGYGNRGGGQFDTSAMATQLASRLGVDEARMKTALDNALTANQPSVGSSGGFNGTPGTRPSGAMPSGALPGGGMPGGGMPGGTDSRRTERLTAMATSIATELNLDQAKVLAALEEVMGNGRAGGQPSSEPTK
jgi:hypothetical protein